MLDRLKRLFGATVCRQYRLFCDVEGERFDLGAFTGHRAAALEECQARMMKWYWGTGRFTNGSALAGQYGVEEAR